MSNKQDFNCGDLVAGSGRWSGFKTGVFIKYRKTTFGNRTGFAIVQFEEAGWRVVDPNDLELLVKAQS